MLCPHCTSERLVMSERSGIEIDYCPNCRGVWLDRGELDKLIERSAVGAPTVAMVPAGPQSKRRDWDDDDDHIKYGKHKKRKGLLGEIFDF